MQLGEDWGTSVDQGAARAASGESGAFLLLVPSSCATTREGAAAVLMDAL